MVAMDADPLSALLGGAARSPAVLASVVDRRPAKEPPRDRTRTLVSDLRKAGVPVEARLSGAGLTPSARNSPRILMCAMWPRPFSSGSSTTPAMTTSAATSASRVSTPAADAAATVMAPAGAGIASPSVSFVRCLRSFPIRWPIVDFGQSWSLSLRSVAIIARSATADIES